MKRGLSSLASIAATAAFVGFLGTVFDIANLFAGGSTEKTTFMYAILGGLLRAMVPTAFGLAVAVLAFCFYRCLLSRLEDFDIEMKNGSLQLIDELTHLRA
jgi:biopolymer transport protein ExbB